MSATDPTNDPNAKMGIKEKTAAVIKRYKRPDITDNDDLEAEEHDTVVVRSEQ